MSNTTSGFVSSTSGGLVTDGWKPLSAKKIEKESPDGIFARLAVWRRGWTKNEHDEESAGDIRSFHQTSKPESTKPVATPPREPPPPAAEASAAKPEDEEPLALQICGWVSELWRQWAVAERFMRLASDFSSRIDARRRKEATVANAAPETVNPNDEEPLALQICGWVSKYWRQWKIVERCKRFIADAPEHLVRWWHEAVEIIDKASPQKAAAFIVEPSPAVTVTAKPTPTPQAIPKAAAITVDKAIRRIREELAVYEAMRRAEAATAKGFDIAITSATVRLVTQTDGAAMPIQVVTAAPSGEMKLTGKAVQTVSLTIYPAADGSAPTASALALADFPIAAYFSELRHALAAGAAADSGGFLPPLGDSRPPEEENSVEFGFTIEFGAEGGLKLAFPHTGFDAAVARRRPLENTVTVRYAVTPQGA
jgi:hypothetical protein